MYLGYKAFLQTTIAALLFITGDKTPYVNSHAQHHLLFTRNFQDAGLVNTWLWYERDTMMAVGGFPTGAAKCNFRNEYIRKFNSDGTGEFIHKADIDYLAGLRWQYLIRCPFRWKVQTDEAYNSWLITKYGVATLVRFTEVAGKIDKYSRGWIDDEVEGLTDFGDKEKYIKQGPELYIYEKASLRPTWFDNRSRKRYILLNSPRQEVLRDIK